MSKEMKNMLSISDTAIKAIEKREAELKSQGFSSTSTVSGELNISGCASGSCMAWA